MLYTVDFNLLSDVFSIHCFYRLETRFKGQLGTGGLTGGGAASGAWHEIFRGEESFNNWHS